MPLIVNLKVFLSIYRMDDDVCRKCVNFFIDFCEDASIPLSPQITKRRKMPRIIPGMKNITNKWIEEDQCKSDYENNTRDNRLQQVTFLHSLRKDFEHFHTAVS